MRAVNRYLLASLAVLGSAWASSAQAQSGDVYSWLERALQAGDVLTYRAQCVAENHDPFTQSAARALKAEFIECCDGPSGRMRTEYMAPPQLVNTVVLEDREFVYQIDKKRRIALKQSATAGSMLPSIEGSRLDLLRRNYSATIAGTRVIAGRECAIVEIMPNADRAGNPWRRLFIDKRTAFPLRIENANGAGLLVNTKAVVDVDYSFRPPKGFFALPGDVVIKADPVHRSGPLRVDATLGTQLGFRPILPQYVPAGYVFAGAHVIGADGAKAVHLMYFDGLSTISLFEEPTRSRGRTGWAPGGPGAHALSWTSGNLSLTLIGDILPQELVQMRDSMG